MTPPPTSRADTVEAADLARVLAETTRRQGRAADPATSAWVGANAGAGKTHVLTSRVLRLLLAGTPPERLLCLTYTKAAAAEMSDRVFAKLAAWVTAAPDRLASALEDLTGRQPGDAELRLARGLFTRAIETPGGLKVQTIHAFCERLLQRFPLEAGVAPGFTTVDDDLGRTLRREAIDATLRSALGDPGAPLGRALKTAIAHAAEDRFDDVLAAAIKRAGWLAAVMRLADLGLAETDPAVAPGAAAGDAGAGLAAAESDLRRRLGVDRGATVLSIAQAQASVLPIATMTSAATALAGGGKTDQEIAEGLRAAAAASDPEVRIAALARALLTKEGEARSDARFVTKAVRAAHRWLAPDLSRARDAFANLAAQRRALVVVEATMALMALAADVLAGYQAAKARRGALDFDDLVAHAASLLSSRDQTAWVLFKLDGGIDHILVDESQDTSPDQWSVITALAEEFFATSAATAQPRTLFAVGDEKQSIYSFQGAAPEMFATKGRGFRAAAEFVALPFAELSLDLSFRSVEPILATVDRVFADPARTPGVGAAAARVHHVARRRGQAGLVEVWPTEKPAEEAPGDMFDPLAAASVASPAVRLADRIAATIAGWLDRGERLAALDRPIDPGDILILVRKRTPFAAPMVTALKAHGIPVAGADRIELNGQLAVQDLLALGDFVTMPEDDLALACVLKSPLVGFSDDDLFALAHGRPGSLWRALLAQRAASPRLEEAASRLTQWRQRADFTPPFEFFAEILDGDGMRARLLARLGLEAADSLDELLALTMKYDDANPASLTGFLAWMREARREIKRDMDQASGEVRVMTVHASKGLEAPIVFLPDTCSSPGTGRSRDALLALGDTDAALAPADRDDQAHVWLVKGAANLPVVAAAKEDAARREVEEHNRLLYVALTRARDRLYVCGFEGKRQPSEQSWYRLVRDALADFAETVDDTGTDAGEPSRAALRLASRQSAPLPAHPAGDARRDRTSEALPIWATKRIAREPVVSLPLAPSQLAAYAGEDDDETLAPAGGREDAQGPSPGSATAPPPGDRSGARAMVPHVPAEPAVMAPSPDDARFLRGTLTHALLQHLPDLPAEARRAAADAYVTARADRLPPAARASIVAETLRVLDDPAFAAAFGPDSRAEIDIAATLPNPDRRGPPLRLTGSIDRLADTGEAILVLDYKTNRMSPADVRATPEAYVMQLAAYRAALSAIYPGRPIRAALLWTVGPVLHELPPDMLDAATRRLWDLAK
ncbi:MAG: double-strand break repair helicase AddA [Hyphomicrobiaceae bacterium]|nr:double-strand break repair helicase AddA [Hyphomicrobiaceae bacterium]